MISNYLGDILKNTHDGETRAMNNFIILIQVNQRVIKYAIFSNKLIKFSKSLN